MVKEFNAKYTQSSCQELHGMQLFGYCFGTLGQIVPISLWNAYAFQYYVYTIGLDSVLVTIGLSLGLLVYAVGSPIMGVISDNKRYGKHGKRKPFLLYGLPLMIISIILMWTPPNVPIDASTFYWPTALYFWLFSVILNISAVIIGSPYIAMLPEQCQTESNRTKVASIQGIFNILGSVLSIVLPLILQSNLKYPLLALWNTSDGEYLLNALPWIAVSFSILSIVAILITYFTVDESFLENSHVDENTTKSINSSFIDMMKPFKNAKYRTFLYQIMFQNIGMRILILVIVPFLTFVLFLEDIQFIIFIVILVPIAFFGFIYWSKRIGSLGLIKTLSKSVLILSIMLISCLSFFIPIPFWIRFICALGIIGISLACLVGGYLFPNPIISQIVEETAEETYPQNITEGISQLSGKYFGLNLFVLNIAAGVASLVLGGIFTGNNAKNGIYIIISLPIAGIFYLIAYFLIRNVKLKGDNVKLKGDNVKLEG